MKNLFFVRRVLSSFFPPAVVSGINLFETTYRQKKGPLGPVTEKSHSGATPQAWLGPKARIGHGFDLSPHLCCVHLGSVWLHLGEEWLLHLWWSF